MSFNIPLIVRIILEGYTLLREETGEVFSWWGVLPIWSPAAARGDPTAA